VVVLGIVFEDLGLLNIVEVLDEVIEICFLSPSLTIDKPAPIISL
jgi:hypothetical protein